MSVRSAWGGAVAKCLRKLEKSRVAGVWGLTRSRAPDFAFNTTGVVGALTEYCDGRKPYVYEN